MTTTGLVLEMTDHAQLIPAPVNADLTLLEVPSSAAERIGALYRHIWQPIGGGGRGSWTEDQWMAELQQPGAAAWVAQLKGEDVSMAEIGWSGNGEAVIVVIGVLPAAQGRGIGGDFLTRLTRLMWQTPAANGEPTRRVWLWTVPGEHPHTILNYLARGFVPEKDID